MPALAGIAIASGLIFAIVRINGTALVNSARTHQISLAASQLGFVNSGQPVRLTDIVVTKDAYFEISLQFRAQEMAGHPNLFQTGDYDTGIRVELSNGALAAVVGNEKQPDAPASLLISKNIEPGRWYDLHVAALKNGFVTARLSDNPTLKLEGEHIAFSANNFWIGQGFDSTRRFTGDIRNVRVFYGESRSHRFALFLYRIPMGLSLLLLIGSGALLFLIGSGGLLVFARRLPTYAQTIWRSAPDRRITILIGCLGLGDFIGWTYNKLLLPKVIAPALGLDPASLPLRAPLFEGSAPYTDFNEVTSFPHYVSNVSWAAPPAEQFRIMLKSWMAHEWPTLWEIGIPFVLFSLIGVLLHLYGIFRLANANRQSSLNYSQRMLLSFLLILTLYPIHFAFDRGNAALHNTGFVILGAAYFLEGAAGAASLSFALAAVSKITPIAFALSFLLTRQWRGVVLTVGFTLVGTLLPAAILHGLIGYNLDWALEGQRTYTEDFAVRPNLGLGYSASLFSAIRFAIVWLQSFRAVSFSEASAQAIPLIRGTLSVYSIVMALVGLDLLIQAWKRCVSPQILISVLAIYQIMAPPIIADYYLTFLVIPLLVFTYSEELRSDLVVPILLVVILIPKSYVWMPVAFSPLPYWISWGVLINGIAVTSLYLYVRIRYFKFMGVKQGRLT